MQVDASGTQSSVTGAIRQAARLTGTDFQYLLATAQVESNFNPNARGTGSSARGLFQFVEQTWLAVLKRHGPALGYGAYADAIARQPSGDFAVTDARLRGPVMNLRADPAANATMAGAFTRANAAALSERIGRAPSEGELYVAHFLGVGGAARLIELAALSPRTSAASAFPSAARANPTIFYGVQGHARDAGEVYRLLVGRYDVARAVPTASTARVAAAPDPARLAETYQAAGQGGSAPADRSGPVFHGLFHSGPRREPVAPVVSALWSAPSQSAAPQLRTGAGPLDLFQDHSPDARALFRGGPERV